MPEDAKRMMPGEPLAGLRFARALRCAFVLVCMACAAKGQEPAGQEYHEAPMLAERVARGELPPVAERLPEEPVVVTPVNEIGRYGGAWRRLCINLRDTMLASRLGYDPLVRWDRTGVKIAPGLAKSWDVLDEGRTYVFHLRKGLKWSDGAPFTSEDFQFYFDDVIGYPALAPVFPCWRTMNGKSITVSAPDPCTIIFHLPEPGGIFLETLAYRGVWMPLPKHYLRQFHPRYTDPEALDRLAKASGFGTWRQLFQMKANYEENLDLPTWHAFKMTVPPPAPRIVAERNPYYWKVDPAGNQLPYLDKIVFTLVENGEVVTLRAMAGEADFQDRRIDPANYGLFMANRKKGGYRVLHDPNPSPVCCFVNQYSKDPELRPIFQDRRFRIALSVAINRAELIDVLYTGMAQPTRAVVSTYDPYYLPEFDEKYLAYDPDLARRLLDEMGMTEGPDGRRRLPDGKPFRQTVNVLASETGTSLDLWQLVVDYWSEVGLDFFLKADSPTLCALQALNGNCDFYAYAGNGLHWVVEPAWYVPWQATSFFAPLYGRYVFSNGKDKLSAKPPPEMQRLTDWFLELSASIDPERRLELGHRILRQWSEECYAIGICRNEIVTIVSNRMHNVPEHIVHDWHVMTPGYIGIEQFYVDDAGAQAPEGAGAQAPEGAEAPAP